jgi:hypothetical protein
MSASALDRRTLLLGTSLIAAMGVSAKSLAMDASPLPMKVADIDPAFEKAFNAGDLDALLKLYDDQSVLVAEPGKPVKGLENIKQALMGFLALKCDVSTKTETLVFASLTGALSARDPTGRISNSEGHQRRWSERPRAATGYM